MPQEPIIYPFTSSREGTKCNQCIALPGCEHGTCEDAFECNCENGWTGAYCDIGIIKYNFFFLNNRNSLSNLSYP